MFVKGKKGTDNSTTIVKCYSKAMLDIAKEFAPFSAWLRIIRGNRDMAKNGLAQ